MDEDFDIQSLIDRYEQMQIIGRKMYFDADEFAVLADYYNSIGDNQLADEIIEEGIIMHPTSTELMILKAKTLVFSESYGEALSFLNNIPDKENIELPLLKIESLFHLGNEKEANRLIDETRSRDLPEDDLYVFLTELGYVMNDIDRFDTAISYLEESLKYDDSNPEVLIDLAYSYEMKSDFTRAIEYNNRLLDMDPYSFDGWINIGKLYSMNDDFEKAIDAFDFALTVKENDVSVLKMKALSLYLNDNVQEAIRIFENCIKLAPDDVAVYDSLLEGYETMEEYDRMLEIVNLKEKRFGSKGIAISRGIIELMKNNIVSAREFYKQVPVEEQNSLSYYLFEGELMFVEDKMLESEAAYMKAALLSEDNDDILDRLANVCVVQEKYEQAAEYLEQLLAIDNTYPSAKSRLGIVRFEIGEKEAFEEFLKQSSDDEIRELMYYIWSDDENDFSSYSREKMILRLNEARENRVLFKNIKY